MSDRELDNFKTDILDLVKKDREEDVNIIIKNVGVESMKGGIKDIIIMDFKENEISSNFVEYKEILEKIKSISQKVFNELGTGFSEYIYHRAIEIEFRLENFNYESKKIIPIMYKDINIGYGEADLVLKMSKDEEIVIELKALTTVPRESEVVQIRTYLNNLRKAKVGCIINFPQPSSKSARNEIDFKCVKI